MRAVFSIASRELGAMFRTPVGWVVTALYTLLTAVVFTMQTITPGEPATLRYFFAPSAWLLIVVAPAISMRLFSEEFRSGTVEPLLTSPVSPACVLFGKYAGAIAFVICMLAPTLAYPALLMWAADGPIDPGAIGSGYLGLVLVAMFYLALGLLVSTVTDSQVLAFLVTLIALVLLMILAGPVAARAPVRLAPMLAELSVPARAADFARGVLETRHIAALLAASGWMLAIAWLSLVLRQGRWKRAGCAVRAGLFSLAATTIAASVGVLAANTNARIDLTFSREHALGKRILARLQTLDRPVELVVAVARDGIDRRARDRVDDVLEAVDHASDNFTVTFIDTGSPQGPSLYEDLLQRLKHREQPRRQLMLAEAKAIDEDASILRSVLDSLAVAADAAGAGAGAGADPARTQRLREFAAFARIASRELGETTHPGQEPDLNRARNFSDLAARLSPQLESVLKELAAMEPGAEDEESRLRIKDTYAIAGKARELSAVLAERSSRLGLTDLDRISKTLESGEAALLIGPDRENGPGLVAIDIDELYPPSELFNIGSSAAEAATGIRAEQLVGSALSVLTDSSRPIVVFVHGESARWIGKAGVMTGLIDRLAAAGIDYAEWAAVIEPDPPNLVRLDPSGKRPVVYVVISPDSTAGTRPDNPQSRPGTERAQRVGQVVATLAARGEPILVNLNPSVFPTFGDKDPIVAALEPLGVSAMSGTPILLHKPSASGLTTLSAHRFVPSASDHPVGSAVGGLPVFLDWPVPLSLNGKATPLLTIDSSPDRWAESQWLRFWRTPRNQRHLLADQPAPDAELDGRGPWTVAAAARGPETGGRRQRAVVVGSNTWFLDQSWRTQQVIQGRPLLVNPGNIELFDSAVLWLAGRDELIAPSPLARPVALIRPISNASLSAVRWSLIGGLPMLILIAGASHRALRG